MSQLIKQGSTGQSVRELQRKLNTVLGANLVVDGQFGPATTRAVRMYQTSIDELVVDGIVGPQTMDSINRVYAKKADQSQGLGNGQFVIFVDAGHGGLDAQGRYVTAGKRYYHEGIGDYYEGVKNREFAERFIRACTDLNIPCIRTYHPWKDTKLSKRMAIVEDWLKQGFSGYLHSFHSDAVSSDYSDELRERTRGATVYTIGTEFSQMIAKEHMHNIRSATNSEWTYRGVKDGNFQLLRDTDTGEWEFFGAILEEWGFHTSKADVSKYLLNSKGDEMRLHAAVETALSIYELWKNQRQDGV